MNTMPKCILCNAMLFSNVCILGPTPGFIKPFLDVGDVLLEFCNTVHYRVLRVNQQFRVLVIGRSKAGKIAGYGHHEGMPRNLNFR